MTLGELAAFVSTHLSQKGIHCVLTGGACVSIYSENRYMSFDLDFVENLASRRRDVVTALSEIGFVEANRHFRHPDTQYFIEFPAGPLAVGSEPVHETRTIEYETGRLVLLSPTESVKDRLAAWYYWNDRQCLEQAAIIAEVHPVDLNEIQRWSEQEGMTEKFLAIRDRLERPPPHSLTGSGPPLSDLS